MEFEYDPLKSKTNWQKHGIDFDEAKSLWVDEDRLEVQARCDDEQRFALVAELKNELWTAFYTIRSNRVRIISVRRARKEERRLYYES